jgi:hypothetical protein
VRVDHRHDVEDLVRLGADVERAVLSRWVLGTVRTESSVTATNGRVVTASGNQHRWAGTTSNPRFQKQLG